MKKALAGLVLLTILLTGCSLLGESDSAIIPVDFHKSVMISNGDFDLEISKVYQIAEKDLGGTIVSLNAASKDTYTFYEIRMKYTNHLEEAISFPYKKIIFSLPDTENSGQGITFVGYCLQSKDSPTGTLERCAYVPSSTPGVYGVTGVYLMNVYQPEPGESSDVYFYIFLKNDYDKFEIAFIQPEE